MEKVRKPEFCILCPLHSAPMVHTEVTMPNPEIWFVGEAPGEEEVKKGSPFVGRAGSLLRESLQAVGWDVPYLITNACLCHPPQNKTPQILAIRSCQWHLDAIFKKYGTARLIVALGSVAAKALGLPPEKLDALRGNVYETRYGPCFVMYHPSRILRSKYRLKSLFLLDLRKALHIARNGLPRGQNAAFEKVHVLTKQAEIVDFIKSIPLNKPVAFDIETSVPDLKTGEWPDWGLDFYHELNSIYSIAFSLDDEAYAFAVDPKTPALQCEADPEVIKAHLRELFSKAKNLIAHNSKFEIRALRRHLNVTPQIKHDTMILAYLINENLQGFYSLKTLAQVYLPDWSDFKSIKHTDLLRYNALDALCSLKLFKVFEREIMSLAERDHLLKAEQFIMNVVLPVIVQMEENGFKVNIPLLYQYDFELESLKNLVKEKFKELTGIENPASHDARAVLSKLAQQSGITLPQTKTGMPEMKTSTLEEILETTDSEALKKAVAYRLTYSKLDKLHSTYIQSYHELINKHTGRIHPSYRPEGTRTGRLSSENPNFQQIPRDGLYLCPACKVFMKAVCPLCGSSEKQEVVNVNKLIATDPGSVVISADYSQIEVRILAHIAADRNLLKAINQGLDLHSYTASQIYGIPYEEILQRKDTDKEIKALRQSAKSVTFGIIYGITPQGLAAQTGKSPEEANRLIELFYTMYPGIKAWIQQVHQFVVNHRWLASPTGRVRHFDLNKETFARELRESQNFPIQSFASDLTLYAAYILTEKLKPYNARLIGLVHDSIKIECPAVSQQQVKQIVQTVMTQEVPAKFNLSVPLEIDIDTYMPEEPHESKSLQIHPPKKETEPGEPASKRKISVCTVGTLF